MVARSSHVGFSLYVVGPRSTSLLAENDDVAVLAGNVTLAELTSQAYTYTAMTTAVESPDAIPQSFLLSQSYPKPSIR